MQAAKQALRQLGRRQQSTVRGVRNMGSKPDQHSGPSEQAHLDEAMREMAKWRTVCYAAVPACLAVAAYDLSHAHEHHEEIPSYPYLRIRTKEFPWGNGKCGLFEMDCPEADEAEE